MPNIWRLGQVSGTTFGTHVSNEMLLNTAKCQGYSFYRFWVIKGKPTVGGGEVKFIRLGLILTLKEYSKAMAASIDGFNSCQVIIMQFRGICLLFYFLYFFILTWKPIQIYDNFWERRKGRILDSYLICASLIHFFLMFLFDFLETSHQRFLPVFS